MRKSRKWAVSMSWRVQGNMSWIGARLTMPTYSSNELTMIIGIAVHVLSIFTSAEYAKVIAVLTAPAAVANSPPAKRLPTMTCCFLGNLSRAMNGIGSNTIIKSVVVLMHPATSKCLRSSKQFCGVADSVQYASGGLGRLSIYVYNVKSHLAAQKEMLTCIETW